MNRSIRVRLSVMMFLEYVIWASWYVTMGRYLYGKLGFTPQEVGLAYNSTALAAMISPFFVGMVADRFFATEKVLCGLHLLGGVLVLALAKATTFPLFYGLLIAHTLCYMPTLALTNSISFAQMTDQGKEFPRIRVLGTVSWIITVWGIGQVASTARFQGIDVTTPMPFVVAGIASIVMGFYCLSLPHTPPKAKGERVTVRDVLGLEALQLLKERSFCIFVLSAFLICIPLSFYFSFAPTLLGDVLGLAAPGGGTVASVAAAQLHSALFFLPAFLRDPLITSLTSATQMTIFGQVFEIFFLMVMPWFFARLGVKWMLMLGMLAWGVRYLLFLVGYRAGLVWPLFIGVLLHGICYDFFFVTAYIYTDQKAWDAIRAKAQGFIAFVTLGAGMFVGTSLSGTVVGQYSFPAVAPAKTEAIAAADWGVGNYAVWQSHGQTTYGKIVAKPTAVTGQTPVTLEVFKPTSGGAFVASGQKVSEPLATLTKPLPRWDKIWFLPAIGAFIIVGLFALMFQYKERTQPVAAPEAAQ